MVSNQRNCIHKSLSGRWIIFTCFLALMCCHCEHQSPMFSCTHAPDSHNISARAHCSWWSLYTYPVGEVVLESSLYPPTLHCEILSHSHPIGKHSPKSFNYTRDILTNKTQGRGWNLQSASSLPDCMWFLFPLSLHMFTSCCSSVSIWNCWRMTEMEGLWRRSTIGNH